MRIIFPLLAMVFLASCGSKGNSSTSNQPGGGLSITAEIQDMKPGFTYVIGYYGDQRFKVDSAVVENGRMVLERPNAFPSGLYLLVFPDQQVVQVLLDTDQTMTIKGNAGNLTVTLSVEGQEDTQIMYQTMEEEAKYNQQLSDISQKLKGATAGTPEYEALLEERKTATVARQDYLESVFQQYPNSFFTAFKRSGQNPDPTEVITEQGTVDLTLYRKYFWENVDFTDPRLLRTPVVANKLKRQIKDFTIQRADSIISTAKYLMDLAEQNNEYFQFFANWIALEYPPGESNLMDAEAVNVFMVQNYFTEEKAFWSTPEQIQALQQRAYTMAQSLVGQTAQDVVSNGPNGETISLMKDVTSDYVIVYMFNPDCDHCREETPKLVELMKRTPKQKMQVFAIAVDTDDQKWKKFIQDYGIGDFINVFDPTNRSIYAKYYVDITPEIYILDKSRTIIAKNLKVFQIEDAIQRYEQSLVGSLRDL
jgi:peroxiredoxin